MRPFRPSAGTVLPCIDTVFAKDLDSLEPHDSIPPGSGSQNWGAKKEVFLDLIQTHNLNVQKGLGEFAMSHLVPLLEFNLLSAKKFASCNGQSG